jgi:hypothetical protein
MTRMSPPTGMCPPHRGRNVVPLSGQGCLQRPSCSVHLRTPHRVSMGLRRYQHCLRCKLGNFGSMCFRQFWLLRHLPVGQLHTRCRHLCQCLHTGLLRNQNTPKLLLLKSDLQRMLSNPLGLQLQCCHCTFLQCTPCTQPAQLDPDTGLRGKIYKYSSTHMFLDRMLCTPLNQKHLDH